ncbi:MAG: hypothetical protein K2K84_06770, partial [Muribaculaceae bacterium]|nr:hypothetical protein [Muribaculaceae bacterium]
MEKIEEILKTVLSSKLMADSLGELADKLGYRGRSTLYRIINGEASERAVAGVCQKLKEKLFADEDSLRCMWATIVNASQFCKIVKPLICPKGGLTVNEVVDAFISMDFTLFPEDFRHSYLDELTALELSDPEAFYTMLAYFLYNHSGIEYYVKGESHRQRSARVLESIGKRFIEKSPENDLAAVSVFIYSNTEILNGEAPVLWSLIRTIATMLRLFGKPIETLEGDVRFLNVLKDREYWMGTDKNDVMLTVMSSESMTNGNRYDVFRIERQSEKIAYVGSIYFMSDEILSFHSAARSSSMLGLYESDGQEIRFEWENPKDDPTTNGNRWTRLDKKFSQSLRHLDSVIDEERLYGEKLKSQGWKEMSGYKVTDVIISRERLTLKLLNGRSLTISVSAAPFLKKVRPNYLIMIYERESDNMPFVCLPQLMHCGGLYTSPSPR